MSKDIAEEIRKMQERKPKRVTRVQAMTLETISRLTAELGKPPSVRHVAKSMGVSHTAVHQTVNRLRVRGLLIPGEAGLCLAPQEDKPWVFLRTKKGWRVSSTAALSRKQIRILAREMLAATNPRKSSS